MKTVRIAFEVYEEKLEELEELMRKLGLRKRNELFNYAVAFLSLVVKEHEKGRIIASMDEEKGNYQELEIPIWTPTRK